MVSSKKFLLLITAFLTIALIIGYVATTHADSAYTERIAGTDRIDTAIQASKRSFSLGDANCVVLARADNFPDALAAAPFAARMNGVLLLTPSNALDDRVKAEIERVLGPNVGTTKTVYLIGGPAALSTAVANAIPASYDTSRIAGADRYETAVEVAKRLLTVPATNTVALCSGANFPDALSVGSWVAGSFHRAILLTEPTTLTSVTRSYLATLATTPTTLIVRVIGGPAAISPSVYDATTATVGPGTDTTRVAGADRYDTSVQIAKKLWGRETTVASTHTVWLSFARGDAFPDALVAGYFRYPILLTPPTRLESVVSTYLANVLFPAGAGWAYGYIFGGNAAIAPAVETSIVAAIRKK